jgi:protein SCO1/2
MGTPDLEDRPVDPPAAQAPGGPERPSRRLDPRIALPLLVILAIAGGAALLIAGTGGKTQTLPGNAHSVKSAHFEGLTFSLQQQAPGLALHNYLGQPVNIAAYRGKAVLVTFLYTHCPDVCPLIASNLRVAQSLMGPRAAARAQIVAVSVDPRGDDRQTVAAFLKVHGMTGRMQYLIGSARELPRVWEAWKVGSSRDAQQPGLVNHSGLVYGISASGRLTTLYPANFKPSEIAHDVPLLASE